MKSSKNLSFIPNDSKNIQRNANTADNSCGLKNTSCNDSSHPSSDYSPKGFTNDSWAPVLNNKSNSSSCENAENDYPDNTPKGFSSKTWASPLNHNSSLSSCNSKNTSYSTNIPKGTVSNTGSPVLNDNYNNKLCDGTIPTLPNNPPRGMSNNNRATPLNDNSLSTPSRCSPSPLPNNSPGPNNSNLSCDNWASPLTDDSVGPLDHKLPRMSCSPHTTPFVTNDHTLSPDAMSTTPFVTNDHTLSPDAMSTTPSITNLENVSHNNWPTPLSNDAISFSCKNTKNQLHNSNLHPFNSPFTSPNPNITDSDSMSQTTPSNTLPSYLHSDNILDTGISTTLSPNTPSNSISPNITTSGISNCSNNNFINSSNDNEPKPYKENILDSHNSPYQGAPLDNNNNTLAPYNTISNNITSTTPVSNFENFDEDNNDPQAYQDNLLNPKDKLVDAGSVNASQSDILTAGESTSSTLGHYSTSSTLGHYSNNSTPGHSSTNDPHAYQDNILNPKDKLVDAGSVNDSQSNILTVGESTSSTLGYSSTSSTLGYSSTSSTPNSLETFYNTTPLNTVSHTQEEEEEVSEESSKQDKVQTSHDDSHKHLIFILCVILLMIVMVILIKKL